MVIPQPGAQRCIDLHLHTQKGHQDVVQSGVAGQRIRGLAAHLELRRPIFGLHGVLHGNSDLGRKPPVVHRLHLGGFGQPAPDDSLRGESSTSSRLQGAMGVP